MRAAELARKSQTLMDAIAKRKKHHKPRAALQSALVKLRTEQLRAELKEQKRRGFSL